MEEELCPFCEMIKVVLRDMEATTSWQTKFDILHSVVDQAKEFGYKDGYTTALMDQVVHMHNLVEDILDEDESKYNN